MNIDLCNSSVSNNVINTLYFCIGILLQKIVLTFDQLYMLKIIYNSSVTQSLHRWYLLRQTNIINLFQDIRGITSYYFRTYVLSILQNNLQLQGTNIYNKEVSKYFDFKCYFVTISSLDTAFKCLPMLLIHAFTSEHKNFGAFWIK